jgi:transglutaminase-like putative cysteine protease
MTTETSTQTWSMTVTPVVAAMTTLCASTALAGVIDGVRWLGYAGIAVMVVTAAGLGLRAIRTPTLVVGITQLAALLCLVTALFTNSAILGFLPGPTAFTELGNVLKNSVEAVQTGVPPVPASTPMLCLVVIAIGLVAVLVDTLAISAGAPAACGLVLLCVYAVPASLADELLPWWSFVLGATSFAILLAVDGAHRHQQWRNRPALPGTAAGVGSPVTMVSAALVLGLLAGVLVTGIGTIGSLPGGSGGGSGGLALKPFTALRGMLDQGANTELYRVRGLGTESRYLRAMTLPRYDRNGGFLAADALPSDDVTADGDLPLAPGDDGGGTVTRISVEPINAPADLWVPVYGIPRRIRDLPQGLFYNQPGGMVYSRSKRTLGQYVVEADMSQPSAADLRLAGNNFREIDQTYLVADGLDPEVVALAKQITDGKPTMFDKALALQKHFERANGFEYRTQTANSSDEEALKVFLFQAKVGYCEQYATAMALLARAAGIPSRVAIGYTAGFQSGDYRSITNQDAHAWVEIFFPSQGWVTFDPTPLTDGRTYEPPYVSDDPAATPSTQAQEEQVPSGAPSTTAAPKPNPEDVPNPADNTPTPASDTSLPWQIWAALGTAVLAIAAAVLARTRRSLLRFAVPAVAVFGVLTVFLLTAAVSWWLAALVLVLVAAAVPALVRAWWRHGRRHAVTAHTPDAATAAWTELMAESWDRGAVLSDADTVRTAARRFVREHSLDDPGKQALRTVVNSIERSWYGGQDQGDPSLAPAFDEVIKGLRRTAPMAWKARLLPKSVLKPRRTAARK